MRKLIIINTLILLATCSAISQEKQLVVNLSPSLNKRFFKFENPKGSIRVTGYDGNDVVINANLRLLRDERRDGSVMKSAGLNPLDISAETDGSSVTLFSRTADKTVDFDIKMPADFSLKLISSDNGIVEVINIKGDIEVENADGDITLENISGSASLSTVYGKIDATFREVRPDYPMVFTSLEGDISISLPVRVNAVLKMKTGTGEINSDFDLIPLKRDPLVKNAGNPKVYSLEDWTVGKINGGGSEYIIRSYNGNIFIRKKQEFR